MKSKELRQRYLKFFQKLGHTVIPSASLVPKEDVELAGTQRVLFTTAGMHPLVPYLMGQPHPGGKRLVNVQKCMRTVDIDEVGDETHNTFFEMLGNWSLGDYWKEEAISWSYEFLVNILKLDASRIYVSVFAGDSDAPFDQESFDIWRKMGVAEDHIFKFGKGNNWWGPVGPTGPCGPDTEMFYDTVGGPKNGEDPDNNNQRFVEIWNDVFMAYDKQADGSYKELSQRNVDTGMGLERILRFLQKAPTAYETDVFAPLMKKIEDLANTYEVRSARIVADHIRSSVFLVSDGVIPSNLERGYILRRLIRRAIRHASLLKIDADFLGDLTKIVVKTYGDFYPNLVESQDAIIDSLQKEEQKFKRALAAGIHQFEKIAGDISGHDAFDLYQNYGFPIELTIELAVEKEKQVDVKGFEEMFKKHQDLSRQAGEKTKGGLAVQSDKAAKLHTATHLMHQALRDVLGNHAHQTGSHITDVRLRFDFTHDAKMTEDQIKKVEDIVNEKIHDSLKVHKEVMPKAAASQVGAIGLFDDKYGDLVNIYYIGAGDKIEDAYSKEFCGGPHAENTKDLGHFKILKEESAGAGVRRIYATIE
ncbi:alanine--tRNA ligase [Candidatus Curtissbacteria bacterium]|nr:alanine--tRNA ligase [Candidatus Curtissbacteria bacterium]